MDEAQLRAEIEVMWPGIKVEKATYGELIRLAMSWAIEGNIPSHLVD
jgi:hypothetical protein